MTFWTRLSRRVLAIAYTPRFFGPVLRRYSTSQGTSKSSAISAFIQTVDNCIRNRDEAGALKVFANFKQQNIPIDLNAYNALIQAAGQKGMLDLAFTLYEDFRDEGVTPSDDTFNYLIESCGNHNRLDWAMHVFFDMKEQGFIPKEKTYKLLSAACEKNGRAEFVGPLQRESEFAAAFDSIKV